MWVHYNFKGHYKEKEAGNSDGDVTDKEDGVGREREGETERENSRFYTAGFENEEGALSQGIGAGKGKNTFSGTASRTQSRRHDTC